MLLVIGPSCRYLGLIFGASHLEAAQLFKQTHYLLMFTCSLLVLTMRTPFASSLYNQNDSPVNGNTRVVAKRTQTLIYNELTGYHDVAVQLSDRMQILRNQSSDGFPDTA